MPHLRAIFHPEKRRCRANVVQIGVKKVKCLIFRHLTFKVVGVTGFEPATPWSQTRCATGLRYTPYALLFKCECKGITFF